MRVAFSPLSDQALLLPERKDHFLIQIYPTTIGNYGLRNHLWPLESRFLKRKSEKRAVSQKALCSPDFKTYMFGIVLQFSIDKLSWNFWVFFPLDGSSGPMWRDRPRGPLDIYWNTISPFHTKPISEQKRFLSTIWFWQTPSIHKINRAS